MTGDLRSDNARLAALPDLQCSSGYDDLGYAARDMKRELKHVLAAHQAFINRTKCAGYSP